MAKAFDQNGSDCEERKLGEQNGLDRDFCQKSRKKTQVRHSLREVSKFQGILNIQNLRF